MLNLILGNLSPQLLLMRLLAVVVALTFHEAAHGLVSHWLGDRTAKYQGRISLNPTRHIDPMGMVLIILFGFGWAKPVMVNPFNLRRPKRDMALISAAGPVSNFLMAFVVMLLAYPLFFVIGDGGMMDAVHNIMYFNGTMQAASVRGFAFAFLGVLFSINIVLGVFNLIPIPPLDGSKIVGVFLPNRLYFRFTNFRYGMWILIILIVTNALGVIITPFFAALYNGMYQVARFIYRPFF